MIQQQKIVDLSEGDQELALMAVESAIVKRDQLGSGNSPARCIAIGATFTAEPVEDALAFLMEEIGRPALIEFAPYNQVFQQLLDPSSLLGRNRQGVNVILVRVEDWQRFHTGADDPGALEAILVQNVTDLIEAVRATLARSQTPLIVTICPSSPLVMADPESHKLFTGIEEQIIAALDQIPNLDLIRPDDFRNYPVDLAYDLQRDRLGHIPYTPLFYTALGTILARRIFALTTLPYKVIVLDCDNTLWKGIVG